MLTLNIFSTSTCCGPITTINSSTKPFGPDGLLREEAVSAQLKTVAQQVVQFAHYSLLAKAMPQPTA